MRRVVYILGAGFSAPLGLPVMANFLEKAKDLYYSMDEARDHFRAVLTTISGMHVANSYFQTDLFNIEEILSILDMQLGLEGRDDREVFTRFVSDVITAYTPSMAQPTGPPQHWLGALFPERPWQAYLPFVGALLQLRYDRQSAAQDQADPGRNYAVARGDAQMAYDIVTLNYDLVIERAAAAATANLPAANGLSRTWTETGVLLAKLHGSVDTGDIVPPTATKSNPFVGIRDAWRDAFWALSRANDIRIIGYSLPESDAAVRYLLRAAAIQAPHLKRIDVVCLDPDGSVRKRYDAFVKFRNYAFHDLDSHSYLSMIAGSTEQWPGDIVLASLLERAHEAVTRK